MESFSKSNLSNFFYKKNNKFYSYYIAEIIFSFDSFAKTKNIYIKNDNLLTNIDVKISKDNLYSINDILTGIFKNIDIINNISKIDVNLLNTSQIDLLNIYNKINFILNIKTSFKNITNLTINEELKKNSSLDYFFLIKNSDKEWINLDTALEIKNDDKVKETILILYELNNLYKQENSLYWNKKCKEYNINLKNKLTFYENIKIKFESLYNNLDCLFYSSIFYFLAFLCACFINIKKYFLYYIFIIKKIFYLGLLFNIFDIILRLIIAERPPVTNLYESIIFVNVICSIIFLLNFNKFENAIKLTMLTLSLFLIQLIGYNYNYDSEIKNLMSVLNTNFWLTTHVLTITIGYALCIIAGIFGHINLYYITKNENDLKFYNSMIFFIIISLFFSFIGTILGGIWADQSWGRFWGWDPKENGALLIVLWLILILHIKIFNKSKILISISIIFLNIIIAISWFGVNLLNIGLHSYGFTKNITIWLTLFIILEFCYIILLLFFYKLKIFIKK